MSKLTKMKLLVPRDREGGWQHILNACEYHGVSYIEFDIYAADWIEQALQSGVVGCIYRPEFRHAPWRQLFCERIRFLNDVLHIPVYPGLHELVLYESKREMAYWLKAKGFPHANTVVFCAREVAMSFVEAAKYPLIHKTDFGNCGLGVRIVNCSSEAKKIVNAAFSSGYRIPSYDPLKLDLWRRFKHHIRPLYRKVRGIRHFPSDSDIDVVLFQDLIEIAKEWRVIKVGKHFFGHEKLPDDRGLRSGGGETNWAIPPARVFDLARSICNAGQFNSMDIDIFEDPSGVLFVNELQTIFGVVAANQMYSCRENGKVPISLLFDDATETWQESVGEIGQDYCYRLRVYDFLSILNNGVKPRQLVGV